MRIAPPVCTCLGNCGALHGHQGRQYGPPRRGACRPPGQRRRPRFPACACITGERGRQSGPCRLPCITAPRGPAAGDPALLRLDERIPATCPSGQGAEERSGQPLQLPQLSCRRRCTCAPRSTTQLLPGACPAGCVCQATWQHRSVLHRALPRIQVGSRAAPQVRPAAACRRKLVGEG